MSGVSGRVGVQQRRDAREAIYEPPDRSLVAGGHRFIPSLKHELDKRNSVPYNNIGATLRYYYTMEKPWRRNTIYEQIRYGDDGRGHEYAHSSRLDEAGSAISPGPW
ncbi:MAG TPA: hypothetical protein VHZ51_26055 [Ktedonobacteraceae bacterium]|nr:hypothetical protein [Ktedonobacteraceae bacterium]